MRQSIFAVAAVMLPFVLATPQLLQRQTDEQDDDWYIMPDCANKCYADYGALNSDANCTDSGCFCRLDDFSSSFGCCLADNCNRVEGETSADIMVRICSSWKVDTAVPVQCDNEDTTTTLTSTITSTIDRTSTVTKEITTTSTGKTSSTFTTGAAGSVTTSATPSGANADASSGDGDDNSALALGLGLGLGIPFTIAALGALGFLIWRQKKKSRDQHGQQGTDPTYSPVQQGQSPPMALAHPGMGSAHQSYYTPSQYNQEHYKPTHAQSVTPGSQSVTPLSHSNTPGAESHYSAYAPHSAQPHSAQPHYYPQHPQHPQQGHYQQYPQYPHQHHEVVGDSHYSRHELPP